MSRPRTPSGSESKRPTYDRSISIPLQDLNRDWAPVFQMFNPNKRGEVKLSYMRAKLMHAESHHGIPEETVVALLNKADKDKNGNLSYDEFLDMVRTKEFEQLQRPLIQRALRTAAMGILPRNQREEFYRSRYMDEYSCTRHPPLFMLIISLIELGVFIYHTVKQSREGKIVGPNGPAPIESRLIYNPHRRYEAWRFMTYMFVHSGYLHIVFNILVQLILGIPLELVHHWWRILIVYAAGVAAGSLGTSITDPHVFLAGASGGVYALIAAHLASVVLNWSEMEFAIIRVLSFSVFAITDIGVAIYYRHVGMETNVGYAAHFAGAIAGLLVGVVVLRNLRKLRWEKVVSLISLSVYIVLMLGGIGWNIFYPSHFPTPK